MKNTLKFALVGAVLSISVPLASAADCLAISKAAAKEISAKPESVLSVVSQQIAANENCAGEVVKAAIVVTEADKKLVAQIVEQAIGAAPKKITIIVTAALSVAPDAYVQVMELLATYTPNEGESGIEEVNEDKKKIFTIKEVRAMSPVDRKALFDKVVSTYGLLHIAEYNSFGITFDDFLESAADSGITGFSAAGNIYSK
jgi:hypothetical protein